MDDTQILEGTRPFMPVDELVEDAVPELEYLDGGNPGWFSGRWNPDTRELVLRYEPCEGCDRTRATYKLTEHVFRLGAQARVGGRPIGEAAYAGYCVAAHGRSLAPGSSDVLPSWDELPSQIQAAWAAAAEAVRKAL